MDMATSPQLPPATPLNGDSNGVNGAALVAMDPARVVDHLAQLLEAALGATRDELEAPGSLLSKSRYSDTLQRCARFTNDAQVCLYIQKDLPGAPQLENGNGESSMSSREHPAFRTQTSLTPSRRISTAHLRDRFGSLLDGNDGRFSGSLETSSTARSERTYSLPTTSP